MSTVWSAVEALDDDHDIGAFDCGRPTVDTWFQEKALANRHSLSTHVCVDGDEVVRAFFALKTVIVPTDDLPKRFAKGAQSGYVAAILLAQMGVRTADQGSGQGAEVLATAMRKAVEAHDASRVQLFIVDAADSGLVPFYEKYGLRLIPGTLRLVATMSAIKKAVAVEV